MKRSLSTLVLTLTAALLAAGLGCSMRYDADELPRKNDGDDGAPADASFVGPADASNGDPFDAAPLPDAAPRPDAAVTPGPCGDVGEMCCEENPDCGFGDPFIECNEENSMCENCGADGEPCCQTGQECQSSLLGCLFDICTPIL